MSTTATCWEDVYRVQTARIAELECENAALRELVGTLGAPNHINVPIEQWQELRADKERLDWFINLDEEDRVKFCRGWYRWTPEEVKAEIDAELRKEAQQ